MELIIFDLLNEPVDVVTVSQIEDAWGNFIEQTISVSTLGWHERRGSRGSGASVEAPAPDNWVIEHEEFYLPPGTFITNTSHLVWSGKEYEVIGEPHEHIDPETRHRTHISGHMKRVR